MEADAAATQWVEDIRGQFGDRSRAMLAALADLDAACDQSEPTAAWVDLRDNDLAVYVLAAGLLHRLTGKRDPAKDSNKPDDGRTSACAYDVSPITHRWSFSLSVTWTPLVNRGERVERHWTFEFGGGGKFSLESRSDEPGHDPGPFARALAAAIVAERPPLA